MDVRGKSKNFWTWYVPDYECGDVVNRSLKGDDRIEIEIHCLTYGEQQGYSARVKMIGKGGKRGFKFNTADVDKEMFCENVRGIKNLTLSGFACETAEALYEDGPTELVKDIIEAIQDASHLEEGDIKNFSE